MQQAFRGRKTSPTQNIMAAVNFDLMFTPKQCYMMQEVEDHRLDGARMRTPHRQIIKMDVMMRGAKDRRNGKCKVG
jgi:hypothetical protein